MTDSTLWTSEPIEAGTWIMLGGEHLEVQNCERVGRFWRITVRSLSDFMFYGNNPPLGRKVIRDRLVQLTAVLMLARGAR